MPEEQSNMPELSNNDDPASEIVRNEFNSPSEAQPTVMEVHHHPDLHHQAKPWKEYFLEFIMIFLAVTPGRFS